MSAPGSDMATEPPDDARLRYQLEGAGLQLTTRVDWRSATGFDGELVVFTPPQPSDTPFESSLTVITRPRGEVDELQDGIVAEQARALLLLDDALLLDSEPTLVGGRPAARALVAYARGDDELTLEQWVVPTPAQVIVISATVLTFDYAYDADVYEDIVASVMFDA